MPKLLFPLLSLLALLSSVSAVRAPPTPTTPLNIPASLIKVLTYTPYVEESCVPTTFAGWPYPAKLCTYDNNLQVTVADPSPVQVAGWIVDASTYIAPLDALRLVDPFHWEMGLMAIANHTTDQSSRIFPLNGSIKENGVVYPFIRGITATCSTGCYCRINSLNRQQWCAYAAEFLGVNNTACLIEYGVANSTLTMAWEIHCLANHIASWTSFRNEHYVAMAWAASLVIDPQFPTPMQANGAAVIAALEKFYLQYR